MGMAINRVRPKAKPIADNLIVCDGCGAQYNPKTRWLRGYRDPYSSVGDGSDFYPMMRVKPGACPICDRMPDYDEKGEA